MRDKKRAVRPTGGGDCELVKPTPPADLWAKLDVLASACLRPAGTFIAEEYAQRYSIAADSARHQLLRMVARGTLETGKYGGKRWFRLKENSDG
jgi:hypothetical protein